MDVATLQAAKTYSIKRDRRERLLAATRFRPDPALVGRTHGSPPTIGSVASATAITSARTWASVASGVPSLGSFTILGAAGATLRGGTFPDNQMVTFTSHTRPQFGIMPYRVRFWFDGSELDIRFGMYNSVAIPQVLVDGQFIAEPTLGTASPHDAYLPLTFGSRAIRLIELRMVVPFGGVKTGPNDTIWPATKYGPRCIIVGDSYTDQTASTGSLKGYGWRFADLMNWPDTFVSGVGGSGYINPGQGVKLRDRLQNDVIQWSPDVVMILMGHNDGASTGAAVQAEASATFTALRDGLPNAYVAVSTAVTQGDNLSATYNPIDSAILAAATPALVDKTISLANPWWITGLGRVGSTSGAGNADLYTYSDGVHFTDAGHQYFGTRLAQVMTDALTTA